MSERLERPSGVPTKVELLYGLLCGDEVVTCGTEDYTCGGGYNLPRVSEPSGVPERLDAVT